jgi:hypothetical protein
MLAEEDGRDAVMLLARGPAVATARTRPRKVKGASRSKARGRR